MEKKKVEIVISEYHWLKLTNHLSLDKIDESGAIAFCKTTKNEQLKRFLVNEIVIPTKSDYRKRSAGFVGFRPEFMEKCFSYCESNELHMIDIHTHPFSNDVSFSPIDDREDSQIKGPYMSQYVPRVELLFMVHGKDVRDDIDARIWDSKSSSLCQVGLILVL